MQTRWDKTDQSMEEEERKSEKDPYTPPTQPLPPHSLSGDIAQMIIEYQ